MEYAIEVKGLDKSFKLSAKQQKAEKTKRKTVHAVDNISFGVKKGEIYGLLGSNGAGKTTTLRMLATLIKPDAGDAVVDGASIVKSPADVRGKIGFLTSELKLEDWLKLFRDMPNEEKVLVDVKGILDRKALAQTGVRSWRL